MYKSLGNKIEEEICKQGPYFRFSECKYGVNMVQYGTNMV